MIGNLFRSPCGPLNRPPQFPQLSLPAQTGGVAVKRKRIFHRAVSPLGSKLRTSNGTDFDR